MLIVWAVNRFKYLVKGMAAASPTDGPLLRPLLWFLSITCAYNQAIPLAAINEQTNETNKKSQTYT